MKPASETDPKNLLELCSLQEGLLLQCLETIEACIETHYKSPSYAPGSVQRLLDDLHAHVDPDCPPPADPRLLASANAMLHDRINIQHRIGTWQIATFGAGQTRYGLLEKLREECAEILLSDSDQQLEEEAADVAIVLCGIAHLVGFDLIAAMECQFKVLQTRTWAPPDARGVISHV